jgi:hypothetical protein
MMDSILSVARILPMSSSKERWALCLTKALSSNQPILEKVFPESTTIFIIPQYSSLISTKTSFK